MLELSSQGHSQPEIAKILQKSQPTVTGVCVTWETKPEITCKKHIQDKLPEEYQKCIGHAGIL